MTDNVSTLRKGGNTMKKRICAVLSALALAFSVPLPVSAEEYTYPKMADDYFALVEE